MISGLRDLLYGLKPYLGVIGGCLIIASLLLPWWKIVISGGAGSYVYPHTIVGKAAEMLGFERTIYMIILTLIIGTSAILSFMGGILRRRGLLAAAGIIMLLAATAFVWRMVNRCGQYGEQYGVHLPVHGTAFSELFGGLKIVTGFQMGFYLAILAGLLDVVSAYRI